MRTALEKKHRRTSKEIEDHTIQKKIPEGVHFAAG